MMRAIYISIFVATALPVAGQLKLDENNYLSLNYAGGTIGSGSFFIGGDGGFSGMYVDNAAANGLPFYGYSIGGVPEAFHYYDPSGERWELNLSGLQALEVQLEGGNVGVANSGIFDADVFRIGTGDGERFLVDDTKLSFTPAVDSAGAFVVDEGGMRFNADAQMNEFTNFTLRTVGDSYGGMYVDVDGDDLDTEKPFYGYAVDGLDEAFHYYDKQSDSWILQVGIFPVMTAGETSTEFRGDIRMRKSLEVDESISMGDYTGLFSALPVGSVYFDNGHFYGKVSATQFRQLDNASGSSNISAQRTSGSQDDEVVALRNRVSELEGRLAKIEAMLAEKDEAASATEE